MIVPPERVTLRLDQCSMSVVASAESIEFIRGSGGLLFVWPRKSRGARCVLTTLRASTDPPLRALEYRRVEVGQFLLFLHPALPSLPRELWLELRGRKFANVRPYWDGLAYLA